MMTTHSIIMAAVVAYLISGIFLVAKSQTMTTSDAIMFTLVTLCAPLLKIADGAVSLYRLIKSRL